VILAFTKQGWEDYQYWQNRERKILIRINDLIKDIMRSPFSGIGKPEPLRGNLSGYWSRRVNLEHRLVYGVRDSQVVILQCRYHYK